jgi:tetrahydromethanopterin S-methyltransferase subunit G
MSDDTAVIDFLRVQFARLHERHDRTDTKLVEVIQRIGALEIGQASLRRDNAALNETVAHLSVRLDHISDRLDRIERRLEIAEATP